jgi:hypothetical protein
VIFGLLPVVGVGQVAAGTGELDRHPRGKRDALVGGAEEEVELEPAGEQRARIEGRQAAELRAVVEQAGVEEVRRQATGLRLELAEAQRTGRHGELHEFLGQAGGG